MLRSAMLFIILLFILSSAATADTAKLYPTDDSYTLEVVPDGNWGANHHGYCGTYEGGQIYGMFRFDLLLYSGATVNSALLYIYTTSNEGTFPPPDMGIARFNGSWNEGTITWNNQPGFDDYYDPGTVVHHWWWVDVTGWTQEWVDGAHDNYGMYIYSDSTGYQDSFTYRTKEYSGTSHDPHIQLEYTPNTIKSTSLGEIKAAFK